MLHSCRNALFYCLLFNSSLNSLEFKFELNCLNLLLKKRRRNLSLTLSPFSPTHSHFPFPSPFLFLSPRAQGQRRGPFPHARPTPSSPSSLCRRQAGPACRGHLPRVSDADSRSPAAARPAPLFPSWPARQGNPSRPYLSAATSLGTLSIGSRRL